MVATSCVPLVLLQTALFGCITYGFQTSQRCHHLHKKTTTNNAVGSTILNMGANNHYDSHEPDDENDVSNRRTNENENSKHSKETKDDIITNQLNDLLDKTLFDPNSPSNTNNWFANIVKNDYDTAEALYAGLVIILGVIVSQEALRIV
ncbi:hypothetical protein ACHAWX_004704, partial [Stephanocyclus meneghinianus]